jgi:superfamily II DNA helicase RecQ
VTDAVFEKDGKSIPYRRVSLSQDGQSLSDEAEIEFTLKEVISPAKRHRRKPAAKPKKGTAAKAPRSARAARAAETPAASNAALEERLRAWRLAEAKRRGVPAFKILRNQSLRAIAQKPPAAPDDLLAIPGVGSSTVCVRATTRLTETAVGAIGFVPRLRVSGRECCGSSG